jgi:ubiquinone/menaquinone biosynthesis C-methylase UbiE
VEAEEYERMAAVEATHWWYAATRALLRQLAGPSLLPGGRFLDAGGGTGATGAWMGEYGTLVASDALPDALSLYARAHPLLASAAAADVQALPFPDGTFDAVLCITVLYHRSIADPAVAVAELARVTRRGGLVVLMEPGVRRLQRAHDRVTHAARRFSLNDLQAAAVAAGLQVSRATGAFSFLVPPAAAKTRLEPGRSTSDLDRHGSGLGGLLADAAALERRVLRRVSIPAGLSVVVVARRP